MTVSPPSFVRFRAICIVHGFFLKKNVSAAPYYRETKFPEQILLTEQICLPEDERNKKE